MQNLPTAEPLLTTFPVVDSSMPAAAESVRFSVPSLSPGAEPPVAGVPMIAGPLAPILVADDDPDDRFFIKRLLAKTGAKNPVLAFDDGTEVVNYLGGVAAAKPEVRQRAPRLLFLDLKMNGLGGFGFLEWAKNHKMELPLTIVVLSNSVEPQDVQRALELGAHRYLVKYPSVQTFTTIVRSVYPFKMAV
jgi:CheY-like chemotaxis protein